MKILQLSVLLVAISATNTESKHLFVETTGSDAVTYVNNDINNPWLTVAKAWDDAVDGDTVYFRAGQYTISTQIDGRNTDDNITFINYSNESVTWTSALTGSVIKVDSDYITVDGIDIISNVNGSDGGFFEIGDYVSSTNFTLNDSVGTAVSCSDNCGIVYAKATRSDYLTVTNCKMTGGGASAGSANTALVWIDGPRWVNISNNEFQDQYCGIYYKHASERTVDAGPLIENNVFKNHGRGGTYLASSYSRIHNNIYINANASTGFNGGENANGTGSDYNDYDHNTFFNSAIIFQQTSGVDPGATYNTVTNNIFLLTAQYHPYSTGYILSHVGPDYNLYAATAAVRENATDYTLANWHTHITANPDDYEDDDGNSVAGTPTFSGGTTPTTIAGFALTSSSDGYQAGSDGGDIGADVSLVGIDASTTSSGGTGSGMFNVAYLLQ